MSMQAAEVSLQKARETAKAFMTQMMAADEQPNCLYNLNDTDTKPATLDGRNVVIQSKDGKEQDGGRQRGESL